MAVGMIHNAYNANSASGCSNAGSITISTQPANESLKLRAANLNGDLSILNSRLAELRSHLFGEAESKNPPDGNAPVPPIQACIEYAQQQAQAALDQLSSIMNRI